MLPLHGLRVLDLGSVVMAPLAGQWLADLGAEVIKVEPPGGESTRYTGPAAEPGMSALFLGLNRGKRAIVLDLKGPKGRDALLRLADTADVLMHNIRPQKMDALGLGEAALLSRNPRLVYATLHGFTRTGPYGGKPAYDDIIQGMMGLAEMVGRQAGAPAYVPSLIADKTTGLIGVIAILAALQMRERTGQGGGVEIPMFESMVAFNAADHFWGAHFDPPKAGGSGYPRLISPGRRPFATLDGHICFLAYTDRHWRSFFDAAGVPELADDPRFADIQARTRHTDVLYETAGHLIAVRTTQAWLDICERVQIPAAPLASLDALPENEHLKATGFFAEFDDPAMGRLRFPGVPVLFDGERPPTAVPPRLGADTEDVLRQAGFSDAEIAALIAEQATP
jgi:crotonobetainyl-CoA:carnitine CoA-transferase CaiB-like acyl-CoA transferase